MGYSFVNELKGRKPCLQTINSPNWAERDLGQSRYFGVKCCLFCCLSFFVFVRVEELLNEVCLKFIFNAVLSLKVFDFGFGIQCRSMSEIRAKLLVVSVL